MKSEILISTEKYACSVLGLDSGWPSQFEPTDQICKLCSSPLSEPMFHPGRKGKSYLLTEMNPFKEVVINVKFCKNNQCKAMHQSFPIDIGKHAYNMLNAVVKSP